MDFYWTTECSRVNHLKTKRKNSTFNLSDKERLMQTPSRAQPDASVENGIYNYLFIIPWQLVKTCAIFTQFTQTKHTSNCYRFVCFVFYLL